MTPPTAVIFTEQSGVSVLSWAGDLAVGAPARFVAAEAVPDAEVTLRIEGVEFLIEVEGLVALRSLEPRPDTVRAVAGTAVWHDMDLGKATWAAGLLVDEGSLYLGSERLLGEAIPVPDRSNANQERLTIGLGTGELPVGPAAADVAAAISAPLSIAMVGEAVIGIGLPGLATGG